MKKKSDTKEYVQLDLFDNLFSGRNEEQQADVVEDAGNQQAGDSQEPANEKKASRGEMDYNYDDRFRQRAERKHIRVTCPDGRIICFERVIDTYIAVLRMLSKEQLSRINLKVANRPLISDTSYPHYQSWTDRDGQTLYLNTQSDTAQKCMQLMAINDQLSLGLTVEIGCFPTQKNEGRTFTRKQHDKLQVTLNGVQIEGEHAIDVYVNAINAMNTEKVQRRGISFAGKKLITTHKCYNGQLQTGDRQWLTVPSSTKDKAKWLITIAAMMHQKLMATVAK